MEGACGLVFGCIDLEGGGDVELTEAIGAEGGSSDVCFEVSVT